MSKPTETIQAEESSGPSTPLRRSCRIVAVSSPAPSESKPIKGRRLSSNSDKDAEVKRKTASSLIKENVELKSEPIKGRTRKQSTSSDGSAKGDENKNTTKTKNSQSVEDAVQETSTPVRKRRNSTANEEATPKPVRGRRNSATSEEDKSKLKKTKSSVQDDKEQLTPVMKSRGRIDTILEEAGQQQRNVRRRRSTSRDTLEDNVETKRVTRSRRSSLDMPDEIPTNTPIKSKQLLSVIINSVSLENINKEDKQEIETSSATDIIKTEVDKTNLDLSTIFESSFSGDEATATTKASSKSKRESSSRKSEIHEKNKLTEHSPKDKVLSIDITVEERHISDNTVLRKSPRLQEKLQKCQFGDHSPHRKCSCMEDQSNITNSPKQRSTEKTSSSPQETKKNANITKLDDSTEPVVHMKRTNISDEFDCIESVTGITSLNISDSSDKENMIKQLPNKSSDTTKSHRESNVFRPKNVNHSFIEPMDVDTTINFNVSKFEKSIIEKNRAIDANETDDATFSSNLSATYIEISEDDLVTEKSQTNNKDVDLVSEELKSDVVSTTTSEKDTEKSEEEYKTAEGESEINKCPEESENNEKEVATSKCSEDSEKITENVESTEEEPSKSPEFSEKVTENNKTKVETRKCSEKDETLDEETSKSQEDSEKDETMEEETRKSPEDSKRNDKTEAEIKKCSEDSEKNETMEEETSKSPEDSKRNDKTEAEINKCSEDSEKDETMEEETSKSPEDSKRNDKIEAEINKCLEDSEEITERDKTTEADDKVSETTDISDDYEFTLLSDGDNDPDPEAHNVDSNKLNIDDGNENEINLEKSKGDQNTESSAADSRNIKEDEKDDNDLGELMICEEDDQSSRQSINPIHPESYYLANRYIKESKLKKNDDMQNDVHIDNSSKQNIETPQKNSLESTKNVGSEELKTQYKENKKINEDVPEHTKMNKDEESVNELSKNDEKESKNIVESSTNPEVYVEDSNNDKTVDIEDKCDEVEHTKNPVEELNNDVNEEIKNSVEICSSKRKPEIKPCIIELTGSDSDETENSFENVFVCKDLDDEVSDSGANVDVKINKNDETVNVEDESKNDEVVDQNDLEESNKQIDNATTSNKNEKLEDEFKDQKNRIQMEDISIKTNEQINMENSFQDIIQDDDTELEMQQEIEETEFENEIYFESIDSFKNKSIVESPENKRKSTAVENGTVLNSVAELGLEEDIAFMDRLTKSTQSNKVFKRKKKTEYEDHEDSKSKKAIIEPAENTSKTKQKKKKISIEKGENFTVVKCVGNSEKSKTLEDILGGFESENNKDSNEKSKKRSNVKNASSKETYTKLEDIINSKSPKSSTFSLEKWFGTNKDKIEKLAKTYTHVFPNIEKIKNKSIDCGVALSSEDVQKIKKKQSKSLENLPIPKSKTARLNEFLDKKMVEFDEEEADDSEDSSEEENSFIDGMAEEGEEDTPSEDSNAIIDEGESIDSYSERSEEDDYESDSSFICDDENIALLPGNEYDLDYNKKKKSRILNVEDINEDVIKIKRKVKPEPKKQKTRIIKMESSSESEEEEVIDLTNNDENKSEAPKRLSTENDRRGNRKSSITIIEDINVKEIKDAVLSNRINQLVDTFCTTIPKKGGVSLNLSLEYAGHSSPEPPQKSKKTKSNKSSVDTEEELKESRVSATLNENMKESKNTSSNNVSLDTTSSDQPKKRNKSKGKKRQSSDEEQMVPCKELRLTPSSDEQIDEEQLQNEISSDRFLKDANEAPSDEIKTAKRIKGKKRKLSTEVQTKQSLSTSEYEKDHDDMEVKRKKRKKNRKPKRIEDKATPSTNNDHLELQRKTYGLLNQLVTDVKNRSRRMIRPSIVQNVDENWCVENNVKVKPSTSTVTEKEIETFKKQKIHPKDFRNQMLYNSARVNRVETKKILQKKGAYY